MKRGILAVAVGLISVILASIIFGTLATIRYQNGISERTITASVDAFLFLMVFATPATLIIGLPIAARISVKFFPVLGAGIGAINAVALASLDDFFYDFGFEFQWLIYGALDGAMIGIVAYGMVRVTGRKFSKNPSATAGKGG